MLLHADKGFEPVSHGSQCLVWQSGTQFICRFQRDGGLAKEHGSVDLEMVIVATVNRIEILRSGVFKIFAVGNDCPMIARHDVFIVAAKHVNM